MKITQDGERIILHIPFSPEEHALIVAASKSMPVLEWIRDTLLMEAKVECEYMLNRACRDREIVNAALLEYTRMMDNERMARHRNEVAQNSTLKPSGEDETMRELRKEMEPRLRAIRESERITGEDMTMRIP